MDNEKSQSAEEHYKFLFFVLSVSGKYMSNVFTVVADNCSTNRAMLRRVGLTSRNVTIIDLTYMYKAILSNMAIEYPGFKLQ